MSPPTEGTSDESITEWPRLGRRLLLKALGVGATLSLGSGVAAANHEKPHPPHIDTHYGYATPDADEIPTQLDPDHEVELHRVFPDDPENPEHPLIFHFEPSGLQVNCGDIVQFRFTNPNHTVTAYHPGHGFQRRVPMEVPAFSSPIVQKDGAWLYRFEHEGLYDLYCGPHEIAGMAMRIVVGELAEEDIPDYEDTFEAEPPLFPPLSPEMLERELNAPSDHNEDCEWPWATDRQVLDTDALNPMNIQEAGEVSFTAVADELDIAFEPEEDH